MRKGVSTTASMALKAFVELQQQVLLPPHFLQSSALQQP